MSIRSRHDSRGPGRGGRHRAVPGASTRTGPHGTSDPVLRSRAAGLLSHPAHPGPTVPSSRAPADEGASGPRADTATGTTPPVPPARPLSPCRGARVVPRREPAPPEGVRAEHGSPQSPAAGTGPADLASPLPRPVAIAVARAAIARARSAAAGPAATEAAPQRRRHRADAKEQSRPAPSDRFTRTAAPAQSAEPHTAPCSPGSRTRDTDAPEPLQEARRAPLSVGARLRAALVERLPLWVQLRCAVEPKTLAALTVVLLVAVGFAVHHFVTGRPESVPAPQAAAAAVPHTGPSSSPGATAGAVVVDVAGVVRDPGVHRLPHGSRVADALKAAGGVRPGTGPEALGGLNQARRLVDGERIVVGGAADARAPAPAPGSAPAAGAGATGAAGAEVPRVSLSSATAGQLEALPGVGPVLARHIIDYRTRHGGFTSVGQLREVDGIGPARFADLEPRVGP